MNIQLQVVLYSIFYECGPGQEELAGAKKKSLSERGLRWIPEALCTHKSAFCKALISASLRKRPSCASRRSAVLFHCKRQSHGNDFEPARINRWVVSPLTGELCHVGIQFAGAECVL
jgi:hypothetical protein